jgi:hypothetical protein
LKLEIENKRIPKSDDPFMNMGIKSSNSASNEDERKICRFSENADGDRFYGEHDVKISGIGIRVTKNGAIRIG